MRANLALQNLLKAIEAEKLKGQIAVWQHLEVSPSESEIYIEDSELGWYKASEAISIRIKSLQQQLDNIKEV